MLANQNYVDEIGGGGGFVVLAYILILLDTWNIFCVFLGDRL